jgi:isoleucyl-tRNA synthetase
MFEVNKNESFSKREERILDFWKENKIFQKSLDQRKKNSLFSFYDGPPFATGLPHYGNLLASI